jgi:RNA polymerase sigma-70 factor (ECF subfamily)
VSVRPQIAPEPPFASCARTFEAELDYVYRTLRRHGVHGRDAEDLAQEVFLVMWRRWNDYDTSRPLRPWLAGIAMKIAQRYGRGHARREIPYDDVDPPDHAPGPDDQLASSRVRSLVLGALSQLPDKYRAIFIMHELDGISVRELADTLAMPLFTVHTRLRRARLRFAAVLEGLPGGRSPAAQLLAIERQPTPAPPEVRERLRSRLAALAVRPPPPASPPPLSWPAPPLWLAVTAAGAAALAVAGIWRAAPREKTAARETVPAARAPATAALPTAGLVGRWSLDEIRDGKVADLSGKGNDCLVRDLTTPIDGVHGGALDLGQRGYLECPQPAATAGRPESVSVSIWIRPARRKIAAALVTRYLGPAAEHSFFLGFAADNLRVWSYSWTGWSTSRFGEPLGSWTHVAFSHDPHGTRLYVDGVLTADRFAGLRPTTRTTASPLTIGATVREMGQMSQHFDGAIDEVRIYDRALSGAEISALAQR